MLLSEHRLESRCAHVVDIWLTRLSDITPDLRAKYAALLTPPEEIRLRRFHDGHNDAQSQFLVARALCRTALSSYVDVPVEAWIFETNCHGKPYVSEPKSAAKLKFNLSHTGGLVACAVTWNCEVGIDVENVRQDVDHLMLARAAFTPSEMSGMTQTPAFKRHQYFYSLWTLKEAYIKARGAGLLLALNSFGFDLDEDRARINFSVADADTPVRWKFVHFNPTPEHTLALAVMGSPHQDFSINTRWMVPLA